MGNTKPANTGPSWTRGFLARGESLVASGGVALAATFVGASAGGVWWAAKVDLRTRTAETTTHARSVGTVLAQSVEHLLSTGELSRARPLLAQAVFSGGLSGASVVLPDGGVLADAEPARITRPAWPTAWPTGAVPTPDVSDGTGIDRFPLSIAGRGSAELQIRYDLPRSNPSSLWRSDLMLGMGAIGAAGLAGLVWTYRRLRTRLRGLGAVGDALRSAAEGEQATSALLVSDRFGPEAAAWNTLLADRDSLRQAVSAARAGQVLTGASAGRRDAELITACDSLWHGLVIVDDRGVVRYLNGAAAVLLAAQREEALGKPLSALVKDERVLSAATAAATGASRQRTTVEIDRAAEGGRGVLRFNLRPISREQAGAAMILLEDVTQQRVADESRNAFVAQVTHELRTPLTNIRLYLETLVETGENDPSTRAKCINVIGQEAQRLERVVADMLSVAEIEAGSLKLHADDVRLDAMFTELETDFKAQAADREIQLAFELPPKLPVMHGDRDKIALALHNLLGNAIKYTPVGGKVAVKVESDEQGVRVAVADNGIGIKPEEHELIFDRFYRAKDKRITGITGSGLGLALARQVVRMHGGDITVQSQIDKGSTFTVTLPLSQAA